MDPLCPKMHAGGAFLPSVRYAPDPSSSTERRTVTPLSQRVSCIQYYYNYYHTEESILSDILPLIGREQEVFIKDIESNKGELEGLIKGSSIVVRII